jgi:hypothetical protein
LTAHRERVVRVAIRIYHGESESFKFESRDVGYFSDDTPAVCERCGAPIRHKTVIFDINGNEHVFGSTCGQRVLGSAVAEHATRQAMRKKRLEHRRNFLKERAVQRRLERELEIVRLKQEIEETDDPVEVLQLTYKVEQLKQKYMRHASGLVAGRRNEMEFYGTLEEARDALGGDSVKEKEPMYGGASKRWPTIIRTARVSMPDGSIIRLRHEDCYGWRVSG